MNNAVKIEELLKVEEERDVRNGKWADRGRELMKYYDDHGHCNVPYRQPPLGEWVSTQRREFKKLDAGLESSITLQRIKILNHMNFVWDASDKSTGKTNVDG